MALAQGQPIKYDDINNLSNASLTTSGNITCNGNISVPNGSVTANQYYGGAINLEGGGRLRLLNATGQSSWHKFLTYTTVQYLVKPTIIQFLSRNNLYTLYLRNSDEGGVSFAYFSRMTTEGSTAFKFSVPQAYRIVVYAYVDTYDTLDLISIIYSGIEDLIFSDEASTSCIGNDFIQKNVFFNAP